MLKFSKYNKGISTPILLSIVVLSAVILGGLIVFLQYSQTDETDKKIDLKQTDQTGIETQSQTQTQAEVGLDEILTKIKNNLKNVKTVHAKINEKNYITTLEQPISETWSGSEEYDFVFPNKKQRFFVGYPIFEGEAATIIIDDSIYSSLKPVEGYPLWFLGKDGQRSVPFFDGPIDFNLTDFPEAWDFTNYAETIEENLGIEKINGIECYHYKMNFKKIPGTYQELKKFDNHFFKHVIGGYLFREPKENNILETTKIEQEENKIKFFDNDINKEILIPMDSLESINFPFTYIDIGKQEIFGETTETLSHPYYYLIQTKGIEGEIWVGKDDLLVYKESYTIKSTPFGFHPKHPEAKNMKIMNRETGCYENVYDVIYSNFNEDITIEHPTAENVITTIEQYLERAGLTQQREQEPYNEEQARDARRKADIRQIITAQEMYHAVNNTYFANLYNVGAPAIPDYLEAMHDPKFESMYPDYIWLDNTKDSSKFCVYAKLEQGGYYAGSHKGTKPLDSSPTTLSCW